MMQAHKFIYYFSHDAFFYSNSGKYLMSHVYLANILCMDMPCVLVTDPGPKLC